MPRALLEAIPIHEYDISLRTKERREAVLRGRATSYLVDQIFAKVASGEMAGEHVPVVLKAVGKSKPWLANGAGFSFGQRDNSLQPARTVPSPTPPTAPHGKPRKTSSGGSLLSELASQFLQERGAGESAISGQHLHQSSATYRLTIELLGDVPPVDLTRRHAAELRGLLLRLPASHGKARNGKTALVAIQGADALEAGGQKVERLKEKTCKRHFSALQQLWKWLADRELVTLNPFEGWTFKNGKASQARDDWSELDLLRLLETSWLGPSEAWDSHRRWFPVLAMWTGMRLEEIARLRPADVQVLQGISTIVIQDQPAMGDLPLWTPKTEAGARAVPVHPQLQALGFLDLVEARRGMKAPRLFPELRPTGPDRKLGVEFSRRFSKLKIDAGIGERTTFHSFRHSVSTILRNTTLREEWIDAVLGHESGSRSQGAQVYLKRIGIENLRSAVEAIEYPALVVEAIRAKAPHFKRSLP